MTELTLKDISEKLKDLDICMMTTVTADGDLESRPMSNNREVEYDGDSWFFTYAHKDVAKELQANPAINLAYSHKPLLPHVTGNHLYISIIGEGRISTDRAEMEQHWTKELNVWFKDGIDTPGIALIHVKAKRIRYWDGWDEGEVAV